MGKNPFSVARQYVWDGKDYKATKTHERFLCHALLVACDSGNIEPRQYEQAVDMIQIRLGEHKFLESWLCCEAGVRLGEISHEQGQLYRFRWLDHLEQLWNQGERK
jgi:hypothetical protein